MHNFRGGTLGEVTAPFFFVDDARNGRGNLVKVPDILDPVLVGSTTTRYVYMARVTYTLERHEQVKTGKNRQGAEHCHFD